MYDEAQPRNGNTPVEGRAKAKQNARAVAEVRVVDAEILDAGCCRRGR